MSTPLKRCPLPPVPPEVYGKLLAELFVSVWNSCGSSDEAAERLGMPHDVVLRWAQYYRTAGVRLKHLPLEADRVSHLVAEVIRQVTRHHRGRTRRAMKRGA